MNTRILFFMATGSPVGGVATWLDRAAPALTRRGYYPVVALVRGMTHNDPERFRNYHPGLETIEVDGRGLDREGRVLAALRTIRRIRPQLVLPLGVLDANDAAMRAKDQGEDLRLIGRAQGNLPPMLADLMDLREGLDHVVCVGALTRELLIRHGEFAKDRVDHIPNGAASPTHPRVQRPAGAPIRLGYIGRMTASDKRVLDIPNFCRAMDALGIDYRMTIAGTGPAEGELRRELASMTDRVRMIGPKTGSLLYSEVYPYLDVFLLFSSSETFGIVLAEAMMNGVVPVTSRYMGFHSERLVVDGENGMSFPVGDFMAAAQAVARLATDVPMMETFSNRSREKASAYYTWDRCFDQWDQCLQCAMSRSPVLPPHQLVRSGGRNSGRLDRLGLPSAWIDGLRRLRRATCGIPVPPGGEEWPLFRTHHTPERLASIESWCASLENPDHPK